MPEPLLYSIREQETAIQEKQAQGSSSLAGEGEAQEGRGSRGHTELATIGFLTTSLAGEMRGALHGPTAWRDHQVPLSRRAPACLSGRARLRAARITQDILGDFPVRLPGNASLERGGGRQHRDRPCPSPGHTPQPINHGSPAERRAEEGRHPCRQPRAG